MAEYADEWFPLDVGFRDVARGLGWFRDAVVAADRDADTPCRVSMYCFRHPTAEVVELHAELGIDRVVFSAPDDADAHHRFLDGCQPLVERYGTRG